MPYRIKHISNYGVLSWWNGFYWSSIIGSAKTYKTQTSAKRALNKAKYDSISITKEYVVEEITS